MAPVRPRRRQCGSMEAHERLSELYSSFRTNQNRIESFTARSMTSGLAARVAGQLITIPVVVHVVSKKAEENISDAQMKSQIAVLNKDFRAANTDATTAPSVWSGLVADANIEFALATKDPKGKATTGITRTATTADVVRRGRQREDEGRGWRPRVAGRTVPQPMGVQPRRGVARVRAVPRRAVEDRRRRDPDSAFGTSGTAAAPFNLGRTATHEIGHWLNLRHIWGDENDCSGTDHVSDTPNAQLPNYGTPRFPHVSCDNGPNGDMFMNYMDYVDDAAMVMFTPGQITRMNAALAGPRSKIGR